MFLLLNSCTPLMNSIAQSDWFIIITIITRIIIIVIKVIIIMMMIIKNLNFLHR